MICILSIFDQSDRFVETVFGHIFEFGEITLTGDFSDLVERERPIFMFLNSLEHQVSD